MVGAATYTDDEISWVLDQVIAKAKPGDILSGFEARFGREIGASQLRYIKNKYGRDPRFNSPLINRASGSPSLTAAAGSRAAPSQALPGQAQVSGIPGPRPGPGLPAGPQAGLPLAGARRRRDEDEEDSGNGPAGEPQQVPKRSRREGEPRLILPTAPQQRPGEQEDRSAGELPSQQAGQAYQGDNPGSSSSGPGPGPRRASLANLNLPAGAFTPQYYAHQAQKAASGESTRRTSSGVVATNLLQTSSSPLASGVQTAGLTGNSLYDFHFTSTPPSSNRSGNMMCLSGMGNSLSTPAPEHMTGLANHLFAGRLASSLDTGLNNGLASFNDGSNDNSFADFYEHPNHGSAGSGSLTSYNTGLNDNTSTGYNSGTAFGGDTSWGSASGHLGPSLPNLNRPLGANVSTNLSPSAHQRATVLSGNSGSGTNAASQAPQCAGQAFSSLPVDGANSNARADDYLPDFPAEWQNDAARNIVAGFDADLPDLAAHLQKMIDADMLALNQQLPWQRNGNAAQSQAPQETGSASWLGGRNPGQNTPHQRQLPQFRGTQPVLTDPGTAFQPDALRPAAEQRGEPGQDGTRIRDPVDTVSQVPRPLSTADRIRGSLEDGRTWYYANPAPSTGAITGNNAGQNWGTMIPPQSLSSAAPNRGPARSPSIRDRPAQDPSPPPVPYFGEPSADDALQHVSFDPAQVPQTGLEYNTADYSADCPFADGLAHAGATYHDGDGDDGDDDDDLAAETPDTRARRARDRHDYSVAPLIQRAQEVARALAQDAAPEPAPEQEPQGGGEELDSLFFASPTPPPAASGPEPEGRDAAGSA